MELTTYPGAHEAQLVWPCAGSDRVERLQAEVGRLQRENNRLRSELSVAEFWVREFAGDVRSDAAAGFLSGTLASAPATQSHLDQRLATPIGWGRVASFLGAIVAPWLLLGFSTYAVFNWMQ